MALTNIKSACPAAHRLPIELAERIINLTGDWELSMALLDQSTRIDVSINPVWQVSCTPLDWAILSGVLSRVKAALKQGHKRFTTWGARVLIRFAYVDILDHLYLHNSQQIIDVCGDLIPTIASAWGRVDVLDWAKSVGWDWEKTTGTSAMDEASRHGQARTLDWWKHSQLPLKYSEDALAHATVKNQLNVLDWWKNSGLPLKIGNVLDFATMASNAKSTASLDWWATKSGVDGLDSKYTKTALYHSSCSGSIERLQWWKDSRFRLNYDKDVLLGATKHGHVAVLQWWAAQVAHGVELEYRFFDIEEALEDAVVDKAGRERTLAWWHDAQNYQADVDSIDLWMQVRKLKEPQESVLA